MRAAPRALAHQTRSLHMASTAGLMAPSISLLWLQAARRCHNSADDQRVGADFTSANALNPACLRRYRPRSRSGV